MKTYLDSDTLQALDASPDAPSLGLQGYYTPPEWARALAIPLPETRHTIIDLCCGRGDLLAGTANKTTRNLIGVELDPSLAIDLSSVTRQQALRKDCHVEHLNADLTRFADLLDEIAFSAPLFVHNPPFSLRWHFDRFEALRKPDENAERWIASDLATLRLTNHLLHSHGEALLITNWNRLPLLEPDLQHCWALVRIPTFFPGVSRTDRSGRPNDLAVIYLARGHLDGPPEPTVIPNEIATARGLLRSLRSRRSKYWEPRILRYPRNTIERFQAAAEEWRRREAATTPSHNITLVDGRLHVHFRPFQRLSRRIDANLAKLLIKLRNMHPLALTLQRSTRSALQLTLRCGIWDCSPEARAAIEAALVDYNRERAPFRKLSAVQRLGFLDEHDRIQCKITLPGFFRAGVLYELSSEVIDYASDEERTCMKNGRPALETVRILGCDLLFTLHRPEAADVHFAYNPHRIPDRDAVFPLQKLLEHFEIPEVDDVTTVHPARYQENLDRLDRLSL